MKTLLALCALLLGLAVNVAAIGRSAAGGVVTVPLVPELTLVGAASERQGDYESTVTVDTVDPKADRKSTRLNSSHRH